MAANPRKFSEKIALHNQKQAEETAAFDEVMKDLSLTRALHFKAQQLQLAQSRSNFYGGSLPNVNQIINAPLEFHAAFYSNLDGGRSTRHHGLVERASSRSRLLFPHRRQGTLDKHARQLDSSPYGSVYLSPPPDTNWRRTNSDSALHTSATAAAAPASTDPFAGLVMMSSQQEYRFGDSAFEKSLLMSEKDGGLKQMWDPKKTPLPSRPKSCEVPNITIFPSGEDNVSSAPPGPAGVLNTGGSLPDLTNLHFPSPLPTPLDPDEISFPVLTPSGGTAPPQTSTHHNQTASNSNLALQLAGEDALPKQGTKHGSPTFSPISQALELDAAVLGLDTLASSYAFFSPLAVQPPPVSQPSAQEHSAPTVPQPIPAPNPLNRDIPTGTQYRNSNAGTPTNQSPTSPVSNQGFSPGTSPQTSVLGSIFGDGYYDQSRQATALSHQLEQFNMFENPLGGISLPSGCLLDSGTALTYSHAGILDYPAAQDIAGKQAAHYNNLGGPIPNIILTGDSPPSLSREFGNTLAALEDGAFGLEDDLRVEPLGLDGLRMLGDPDAILTEDAFRLDGL
uniref:CREB-regulated transcription coactivator 1-like n=1 Tax=Myxine glutinosa TaxID=7769 RepID=UPI0035901DBC